MFIFIHLLLAHFIADFPLQLSSIYKLKLIRAWGSFVHSGIVVIVCIALSIPFLYIPEMWVVLFWIWLIHGLQDWLKVTYCERIKKDNLWIFILDQLMHIALICVVFLIPKLSFSAAPESDSLISKIYNNSNIIIYAMGFIFAGFGGVFLNLYMKEIFLKLRESNVPEWKEKYYGIIERILIALLVILGGCWFLLILLFWGVRIGLAKSRKKELYVDLAINTIIAVAVGVLVKVIVT